MLVSYSIAEEGSNNLYISLIQVILTKMDPSEFDLVEIEMIFNYFPHNVFNSEEDMRPLRDAFYEPLLMTLQIKMSQMENR